jgi:hypothetical protein
MLNLLARAEPRGNLREFVAWIYTDEARALGASLGYATIKS